MMQMVSTKSVFSKSTTQWPINGLSLIQSSSNVSVGHLGRVWGRMTLLFYERTLNPFPMGSRPFGRPFNFSYFPVVSASIPFASLFMVFPTLFYRLIFATKISGGNLEYSNHVPCPISCCKNQNVHFLRFFEKNPLQGKCALVNHPINNHLRIRWSVIFGASTPVRWMTSSRLTDLSPAENQNFEKWKNHKEKNDFTKTIGKMQIDVTNHYRFGTRIRNRFTK